MELKIEWRYGHSYAREFGSNDSTWYMDAYGVHAKEDGGQWRYLYGLRILYFGHAFKDGNHWYLSPESDIADAAMNTAIGSSDGKTYPSRAAMQKELIKIAAAYMNLHRMKYNY